MKGQLKGKKMNRGSRPVLPLLPAARQPSGYSSASFYDLSSLPSLAGSATDPDFEYSSSESSSSSEDATSALSKHTKSSVSSAPVSSLAQTKPSEGSSSHSECPSSAESGPTLEQAHRAASGDASPFGHTSGIEERVVDSDSQNLISDGDPAAVWPTGPSSSGAASPPSGRSPIVASPASSLASGPSGPPQGDSPSGNPSQVSSEDESDLEGPVRFVVYSPHLTQKDLRGDCSCWQEKPNLQYIDL